MVWLHNNIHSLLTIAELDSFANLCGPFDSLKRNVTTLMNLQYLVMSIYARSLLLSHQQHGRR